MKLVNGYILKGLAQKELCQLNDEAISTHTFLLADWLLQGRLCLNSFNMKIIENLAAILGPNPGQAISEIWTKNLQIVSATS